MAVILVEILPLNLLNRAGGHEQGRVAQLVNHKFKDFISYQTVWLKEGLLIQ
jgi:hypothetical protein